MALNKQKGNMYGFIDATWNPIRGKCVFSCNYCFMNRWNLKDPPTLIGKEMNLVLPEGRYIFVGSSIDMWHNDVPDLMIREVLRKCSQYDNTYLFQSKNPFRFLAFDKETYPEKTVLCTTIESNINYNHRVPSPYKRVAAIYGIDKKRFKTMITIEPVMDFDVVDLSEMIEIADPDFVNIGANSGSTVLPEPSPKKIRDLFDRLQNRNIKVHIKANMKRICPYDLSRYTDRGLG